MGQQSSLVVGGVKLVSSVLVGDMGSIVFPAARCMVEWIVNEEKKSPGWLREKRVIGKCDECETRFDTHDFQS